MDALIEFLWTRQKRGAGHDPREAAEWACSMLAQGIESDAILLLAGNPQFDSQRQEGLIAQAVRDMGRGNLLEDRAFIDALESEFVADYYAGRTDGWTLIDRAVNLYYNTRETKYPRSLFWVGLSEDSGQHGQGLCVEYHFDRRPFDDVLEEALTANGFPRPPAPN